MTIAKKILVATDFSELGQTAVEHGLMLTQKLGSTLDVVHVFTLHNVPESASQTREQLNQAEHLARTKLNEVGVRLRASGTPGQVLLHFGDPAAMILLSANDLHSDLIVMGTHGRKGLGRLVMGSTAEAVLRQSPVPVLIVKHENEGRRVSTTPARV